MLHWSRYIPYLQYHFKLNGSLNGERNSIKCRNAFPIIDFIKCISTDGGDASSMLLPEIKQIHLTHLVRDYFIVSTNKSCCCIMLRSLVVEGNIFQFKVPAYSPKHNALKIHLGVKLGILP
jgi:hypothetical protein